jgi:hypothetical protein
MRIAIWVLAAFGALVTALNFYLSFVRVPLYRLQHDGATPRYISGLPLVGSLALWIAAALCGASGAWGWAGALAAASLLDTGGLHWFALMALWDLRTKP